MDREARNGCGKSGGAGTESERAGQQVRLQVQQKRAFAGGEQVGRVVQIHAADRELAWDSLERHTLHSNDFDTAAARILFHPVAPEGNGAKSAVLRLRAAYKILVLPLGPVELRAAHLERRDMLRVV